MLADRIAKIEQNSIDKGSQNGLLLTEKLAFMLDVQSSQIYRRVRDSAIRVTP